MTVKVSFFLTASTLAQAGNPAGLPVGAVVATGSISENWYTAHPLGSNALKNACEGYQNLRAALLPGNCSLTGWRAETVDQPGVTVTGHTSVVDRVAPGMNGLQPDIPQMALRYRLLSADTDAERYFTIAAVPDERVTNGTYKPAAQWLNAVTDLMNWIKTNFKMQAVDQTQQTRGIVSISNVGAVTLAEAFTVLPTVGSVYQVLRADKNEDKQVGGQFVVNAVPDATHMTLAKWYKFAAENGKLRRFRYTWDDLTFEDGALLNPKVTTRKIGRPTNSFRGRA